MASPHSFVKFQTYLLRIFENLYDFLKDLSIILQKIFLLAAKKMFLATEEAIYWIRFSYLTA
jgi:hypothetical protein